MAPKKKSSPNPRKSKSLKDLELENEVIYNKKHVWMRRLFFEFLNDRFPKARKPRSLYPATAKLLSDTVLGNCLDWYWAKEKSTKPVSILLGFHTIIEIIP